jgi:hypothetical protein
MAADPRDYTTVAKVQEFVPNAPSDATLLQDLVTRASVFLASMLSRDLIPTDRTEVRNGAGQRAISTRQWPINSVASVTIDGDVIPRSTSVSVLGYTFDDKFIYLRGYRFTCGIQNVVIAYNSGYADADGAFAVPPDIEQATLELINEKLGRRSRPGVSAKGFDGQTISFTASDLTPSIKAAINNYKKVWEQP